MNKSWIIRRDTRACRILKRIPYPFVWVEGVRVGQDYISYVQVWSPIYRRAKSLVCAFWRAC